MTTASMTADEALLATGRREKRFGAGSQPWPYRTHRPRLPAEYPEIGGWFDTITKTVSRAAKSAIRATPLGIVAQTVSGGPKAGIRAAMRGTPLDIVAKTVSGGPKAGIQVAIEATPAGAVAARLGIKATPRNLQTVKTIASNPMVRVAATGAAFVFPPIGVPLAAGVAAANMIAGNAKSLLPGVRKAAAKTILRTAAAAKSGDQDARRGLQLLAKASKSVQKTGKRVAFIISPAGRIFRDASV